MAKALGGKVRLGKGRRLERQNNVMRFDILDGPSNAPATVVTKRPRGNRSFNPDEITGPDKLTGDIRANLIVIEDLGDVEGKIRSDHLLITGTYSVAAERALVNLWRALGRLHAETIGHKPVFDRIRKSLGPESCSASKGILRLVRQEMA
jgi:hypothetical protein